MSVIVQDLITIPDTTERAEPIRIPQPGRAWTVADLWALSGTEHRYELVRGELLRMSPASPVQGRYAGRLSGAMQPYVDDNDLGEVYVSEPGFELQPEPNAVVRAPDVAFVRTERIPAEENERGFWAVAPDLAVEIIAPSERADEINEKVQDYLAAGTRLVWLVYPKTKTVVEYRSLTQIRHLGINEELDGGDVIPGFRYPLSTLFRQPKRAA